MTTRKLTTRKPKLRFLSALLAVAMLLTLLPTAAFAETGNENNVVISFIDGIPDTKAEGVVEKTTGIFEGTGWTYDTTKTILTIQPNYIADFGDEKVDCRVQNSGEIKSGYFYQSITNNDSGRISGGHFWGYIANFGKISDGVFQQGSTDSPGTIEGGIFYNISQMVGKFKGGIYKKKPNMTANIYTLEAADCTINGEWLDSAYVAVSDPTGLPQKIKISFDAADKFESWDLSQSGLSESDVTIQGNTIEFDMPQHDVKLSVNKKSTNLELDENGLPIGMGSTTDGWRYVNGTLTFFDGYQAKLGDTPVNCPVENYGEIVSGAFHAKVTNYNLISNGDFVEQVINKADAIINGGTFKRSVSNSGTVNTGVFGTAPRGLSYYILDADNSTINRILSNTAYIIVKEPDNSPEITVESLTGKKFLNWTAEGMKIESGKETSNPLIFTAPTTSESGKIVLTAIKIKSDVVGGEDGMPTENGEIYKGSEYDGWTYDIQHNRLNISDKYTLDIGESTKENPVDWRVENNGIIRSGSFAGAISNYATIENGTYLNAVTNYGTVKNGTYAGRFVNSTRTTTDADGNTIYADGIVENGVFSRYADFGNQAEVMPINGENGFNVLWIKLGDATVNGCITEQAGIVGAENIVVTANNEKSFDHWSVSGDADLTEIQKQLVGHEKDTALHLTLSGTEGGMILLTAETNALPGVLTAKDFVFKAPADLTADGTAKNAAVTTEKAGVGEIALHYYDAEGNLLAKAPTKAGTYTVTIDVAGTDKYEGTTLSDPDWSFTVAEKTYNVTVVNGVSAMTTAAAGAKVTVKANAAPAGQKFSKWVSDSENVLFVEKTDAETSFIMPEGDVTITAAYEKLPEEPEPEVKSYMLHVFDGETEVEGVLVSEAKAGETVTVRLLRNAIPGGQMFDHWEVLPETLELKDASAAETTFEMPEEAVTLRAVYRDIVVAPAKPSTASVVAATAVIGTGVVLAGWTAYNMGTELYAKWVLPAGAEMPATRGELAALLWQEAGSPEPADAVETMTDAEKAAQWAVESGLMTESRDAGFAPEKKVGKLEVFMTLKKAETLKK